MKRKTGKRDVDCSLWEKVFFYPALSTSCKRKLREKRKKSRCEGDFEGELRRATSGGGATTRSGCFHAAGVCPKRQKPVSLTSFSSFMVFFLFIHPDLNSSTA